MRHSAVVATIGLVIGTPLGAQAPESPRERDRGAGQPTSMFATYIARGELLVYPFFEAYRDRNHEYKPSELGYGLAQDFRGKYRASERLLFVAYGISDRLAVEFEAATISARLERAAGDPSAMPAVLEESGLGDVEGQLRFRWTDGTARVPEVFSYLEVVAPNRGRKLIGTEDWEFKFGTGAIRSFSIGTVAVRVAAEYAKADGKVALGEYAVEFIRALSSRLRFYTGLEGTQDEMEWISELQVRLTRFATLKLNAAVGATSKATDWAPEIGILFRFPGRR